MSLIAADCVEYKERRKVCTAEEKGKKYVLNNPSLLEVSKIRLDKCVPQKEGQKLCDYLMSFDNGVRKRAIFIELKGRKIEDAAKQICSSVGLLKKEFSNHRIDARIVGNRDVPGYVNTVHYRNLAKEILPTKGNIDRSTNGFYSETV